MTTVVLVQLYHRLCFSNCHTFSSSSTQ